MLAAAQPEADRTPAGSIAYLPPPVFRGIAVTHAAGAIAPAVAELTILLILLSLRQVHKLDAQPKRGEPWDTVKNAVVGRDRRAARGRGRRGLHRPPGHPPLAGLGAEVWVYDPYLDMERAAALGVRHSALDDIFAQCPIVTLQAPPTKETYCMVGASSLPCCKTARSSSTRPGRTWWTRKRCSLNCARTVPGCAGRIRPGAAARRQPFRTLDNVVITPHVPGIRRRRRRQGQEMVNEIARFLSGEPLHYPVTVEMLEIMA